MRQTEPDFPPVQLARLPSIDRIFPLFCGFGGFNYRDHAAIRLGDQYGHTRPIRQIAPLFLARQSCCTMLLRDLAYCADRNVNPIMFLQFP